MSDETIASAGEEIEVGEWRRVSPLSIAAHTVKALGGAIIPAAFILFGAGSEAGVLAEISKWLIPILLLIIAANVGPAWLGWYRLRYRIGENDVRLEQGILSRSARSVPYDRIQDVSLEQKLIPRFLGLVEVKFETGAGGKEELKLTYVSEEEGERLREVVRELVEGADEIAAAPAVGHADRNEETVSASASPLESRMLFDMPPRRLFTFGLFSFSLVIFAVLLGVAQQFEVFLPYGLEELAEQFIKDEQYVDAAGYVSGLDTGAKVLAAIYAFITIVVVGLASGIAKTFVRDWDFRLERTAKGFRRRRGLFTKTDVVMPVHRVQALIVSTGWLRRRFGWHGLSFISLAQDSGGANHDVAPFAKMAEIEPIAREAGFTLPDDAEEWRRPSPNYYFDRAVIQSLFVFVIGVIALGAVASQTGGFTAPVKLVSFVLFVVIALIIATEIYRWRYDRHALDPAQVLSRKGWLAPRTQVANRVKLHSVEIAQGPLARWRGYCDLKFGMAGGRFAFNGLAVEDAQKLRRAVLDSIASVDFARLPR